MRRFGFVLRIVSLTLAAAVLLQAAAPWIITLSGPLVKQTVVIVDWHKNLKLLTALDHDARIDPASLAHRPFLEIGLFWGPQWLKFLEDGGRPESLTVGQANQRGRFYPADGANPAVWKMDDGVANWPSPCSSISDEGLVLLSDLGVTTRVNR